MPQFRVRWEIDIEADTPRDAAKEALDLQRDKDSICTHFTVIPVVGVHFLHESALDIDVE